jgi:hypothetical protein
MVLRPVDWMTGATPDAPWKMDMADAGTQDYLAPSQEDMAIDMWPLA